MRKNFDFTALELMVVIGIIAIVMSIAVPSRLAGSRRQEFLRQLHQG